MASSSVGVSLPFIGAGSENHVSSDAAMPASDLGAEDPITAQEQLDAQQLETLLVDAQIYDNTSVAKRELINTLFEELGDHPDMSQTERVHKL